MQQSSKARLLLQLAKFQIFASTVNICGCKKQKFIFFMKFEQRLFLKEVAGQE